MQTSIVTDELYKILSKRMISNIEKHFKYNKKYDYILKLSTLHSR